MEKIPLYKQNLLFSCIHPQQSIYDDLQPGAPYESQIKYLRMPIGKYNDPDIFLDAYNKNSNSAMKSLCLAGISKEMSNDWDAMMKICATVPEAIQYLGKDLQDYGYLTFVAEAIEKNPDCYACLHDDAKKSQSFIDAYARGMMKNGVTRVDIDFPEEEKGWKPLTTMPIYKHDIDSGCDKSILYSPENYRIAHELMIVEGPYKEDVHGDRGRYHSAIAFLQMARLEAVDNPELLEQYNIIEADNIKSHIDKLQDVIRSSPTSSQSIMVAEAVAYAQTMPGSRQNIDVIEMIKQAEKDFYVRHGDVAREKLKDFNNGQQLSDYNTCYLDTLMEMSANHPEMNISDEQRNSWWEKRGHDYEQFLKENPEPKNGYWGHTASQKSYFEKLYNEHVEMRVGEQLTIDGFEQNSDSQNIDVER